MATILNMPKLGLTMTEGTVSKWNKKEGDLVEKGEILYEVATDKINNDVECTVSGTLLKILVPEGQKQQIKAPVAIIGEAGEDITALLNEAGTAPEETPKEVPAAASTASGPAPTVPAAAVVTEGYVKASPLAKKRARELGLDLARIAGTGPEGRVVEKDVLQASAAGAAYKISPAAAGMARTAGIDPVTIGKDGRIMKEDILKQMADQARLAGSNLTETRIPMTQMRQVIAERMLQSVQVSPAVHYQLRVDATEMMNFRDRVKQKSKITYTDILVAITARVLRRHPLLNASVDGNDILVRNYVNMGVAVALEEGLLVPVVKNADLKSFREIGREISELAAKARGNALTMEEMSGGTFTITNLGMFGMEAFTPIINQPEVAILGVNSIVETPVSENGTLVFKPMINLSLSADHRVVDGAVAAHFMQDLKEAVENPLTLLW
ncbi:dihydrolipoamide acetyltransferase family protein [Anoxynatronum buryatiense]|uniref:Dihydrolipoamide acetyltransferase component of pyruvate dehydrogenase complex n=1 Tax=Anoxynatronum buryatiense TaxID=489973 RepID=A0AA45WXU0_9CLOT|nr:dihydrolipoamide acetyltransferase family protein [Anoxynatronum buryatiense]SMP60412.1 pyruvate dehydrogenase E2 component (dihydrolipoamide acetyltransferase) [Anoxynatronum buryatiense]